MANLVVDSSVAVAWCLPDEHSAYATVVLFSLSRTTAVVPRLWAYEVRNAVLMGIRRGRIQRVDALAFLNSLADLNVEYADPVSYESIFLLAEGTGLTVYDAAYIDLARREDAMLATLDGAVRRVAADLGVRAFEPSPRDV